MSGFDPHDAPDSEQLNNCIRCGMCLPSCPTYQLTGRERSSPRGRISLIRAVAEGDLPIESASFQQEMSDCLGCLACVTACPAGVQYGQLLETARDQIERLPRPWWKRWATRGVLGLFDRPRWLSFFTRLLFLYQRSGLKPLARLLPKKLYELQRLLPQVAWKSSRQRLPAQVPATGPARGRVAVLLGCVMDVLFVRENLATVEVLQRQGFACSIPQKPTCCGALHAHTGQLDWARHQARQWIEAWEQEPVDAFIVNSAGCGNCMKHYPELFREDAEWHERAQRFASKVRDVQEFLAEIPLDPALPKGCQKLTYHDACHLAHGQGIRQAPRQLLREIAGDGYRELGDADLCCGSAGTYNVTHFESASQLLDKKVDAILATGAEVVGVANPGCLLQIRYGLERCASSVKAEHPVVLLNEAWKSENQSNT